MSVFDIKNLPEKSNNELDKPLIMLVDDEVENINVLRQLLESHFQIITGLNGAEAIDLIDNMVDPTKIQLIITDQRMPIVTGVEFLEKIVDRMPDTIRIILTGYSDTQVIIDAINKAKLYKFMTKPFDPVELSLTVKRGVEAYQMRQALVNYAANLEKLVEERTEELNEKNEYLLIYKDKNNLYFKDGPHKFSDFDEDTQMRLSLIKRAKENKKIRILLDVTDSLLDYLSPPPERKQ